MMKRNKSFQDNCPLLYIVATPIGNINEFSKRAIEILQECDLIGCEDTRNSGKLFSLFNIHATLISLHEHNELEASQTLIEALNNGKKVAYVSDAGYPGISDPGHRLIELAIKKDINISVINGSNALLPALVGSGLDTSHFYFYGFLASKESAQKKELESLKNIPCTLIFYESPHRIMATINSLYEILGDRQACIVREITKIHEEYIRGSLKEFLTLSAQTLKGEMVIIVDGKAMENHEIDDEQILKIANELIKEGLSIKSAAKITAQLQNINKNYVYDLIIKNQH